jgi:tetratricopeptide (TPR) repeat protein
MVVIAESEIGSLTSTESRHISGCTSCREELAWLRVLPVPSDISDPGGLLHKMMSLRRQASGSPELRAKLLAYVRLAILDPLPVRVSRGATGAGGSEGTFASALELYRSGEYEAAELLLQRAADFEPQNPLILLYLGSSRLLLRKPVASLEVFRRARAAADDPQEVEEIDWQLANACLAAEEFEEGLRHLLELRGGGGHRAADAMRLLDRAQALEF